MNKEVEIGKIYKSKICGNFIVVNYSHIKQYGSNKIKYYNVKFLNTDYKTISSKYSILKGEIYDYMMPSKSHKGFLGGKKYSSNHFLYKRWKSMMERCYREKNKDYKSYGAKGCVVCDKWHNFQNYVEEVSKIEGFNKDKIIKNEIELDKDTKVKNNKIYSLETCIWLNKKENNKHHAIKQFENHIIIDTFESILYYVENMDEFTKNNYWINKSGLRTARKNKTLYKKRWYILYESYYNENKNLYNQYLLNKTGDNNDV